MRWKLLILTCPTRRFASVATIQLVASDLVLYPGRHPRESFCEVTSLWDSLRENLFTKTECLLLRYPYMGGIFKVHRTVPGTNTFTNGNQDRGTELPVEEKDCPKMSSRLWQSPRTKIWTRGWRWWRLLDSFLTSCSRSKRQWCKINTLKNEYLVSNDGSLSHHRVDSKILVPTQSRRVRPYFLHRLLIIWDLYYPFSPYVCLFYWIVLA